MREKSQKGNKERECTNEKSCQQYYHISVVSALMFSIKWRQRFPGFTYQQFINWGFFLIIKGKRNHNQTVKQMLEVWDTHLCKCWQNRHHVKAMWKLSACVISWSDATAGNFPVPSDKCFSCFQCLQRNSHTFWLCMQSSFLLNSI